MKKFKRITIVLFAFLLFAAYFYTSQMNANDEIIEDESEEVAQEEVNKEIIEEDEVNSSAEPVQITNEIADEATISPVAFDDAGWGLLVNRDITWTAGTITTPQQLAQFAYLVNNGNNFAGQTVAIGADIDLAGNEWFPIGAGTYDIANGNISGGFSGTFDGGDYTISNMSIYANHTTNLGGSPSVGFSGLFGYSENTAIIKNVTVTGNVRVALGNGLPNGMAGGIVGYHSGLLDNVYNYVNVQGQYTTGGLVGYNAYGIIKNSYNYGAIYSQANSSSSIGGLVGVAEAGKIISSANYGKVTSAGNNQYVGGIVGTLTYASDTDMFEMLGAYNQGTIIISNYTQAAGGIIGYACWLSSIKNVYQAGTFTTSANVNSALIGQIVGRIGNMTSLGQTHSMDLSDAYYNSDLSSISGIGTALANATSETLAMNSTSMQATNFINTLNTTNAVWVQKENDFPIFGTVFVGADYSAVVEALSHVPIDLNIYTSATVASLQQAITNVVYGKASFDQPLVDAYATAINNALQALQLKLIVDGEKNTMFVGESMSLEANLDGTYTHDETKLKMTSTNALISPTTREATNSRHLTLEATHVGETTILFESDDGQTYSFDLVIKAKDVDTTAGPTKTNKPINNNTNKGVDTMDHSIGGLYHQILFVSLISAVMISISKIVRKMKR